MKKLLYIIPLFICMAWVRPFSPIKYYIASAGNDSNNGTSPSTPWKTVTNLGSTTLNPGDSVLFNRGDVFTVAGLVLTRSGTSVNPIVYGAYGSGSLPILTNFITAGTWISDGGGIWHSAVTTTNYSGSGVVLPTVLINGVNTAPGRTPGFYTVSSATSTSITGTLTGTPNWTGANIVARTQNYWFESRIITSQVTGTLNFAAMGSVPQTGYGYFITNDSRTLTNFGDWSFNRSTGVISVYFGSGGPGSNTVQVEDNISVITDYNASYVTLINLNIQGGGIQTNASQTPTNLSIINCTIANGFIGIGLNINNYTTITNCNITGFAATNIDLHTSSNCVVTNNTITNNALFPGMAALNILVSGINNAGNNNIIQNNIIQNMGYDGIITSGLSTNISQNFIQKICLNLDDGGGIQSSGNNIGSVFFNNLISNGYGNNAGAVSSTYRLVRGIYLDDSTNGVEVNYNVVDSLSDAGIFVHNGFNDNIHHNTFYNTQTGFGVQQDGSNIISNITFQYNSIFAYTGQLCLQLAYNAGPNGINTIGNMDYNTYSRYGSESTSIFAHGAGVVTNTYSLATFHAQYPNNDGNSQITPSAYKGGQAYFLYHSPLLNQTQVADATYQAPDGNYVFINGQTMQVPLYGGAVLLKVGGYPHYY